MAKSNITGVNKVIKGLTKEEKVKTQVFNKAIHDSGFFLEGEIKQSIAGHRVERRSVDTGQFLQSVHTDNTKFLISKIISNVRQAIFLEKGTSRIKARRHFGNSSNRNEKKIEEFVLNKLRRS